MAGRNPSAPGIRMMTGRSEGKDSAGRDIALPAVFPSECPEPPKWLPPYALEEWERVGPQLAQRHLLKDADRASFTAYCLAWERVVRSWESEIPDDMFEDLSDQADARRRLEVEREAASKELRQWAVQFGLTPVAGVKLIPPTPPKQEDDPFV